MAARYGVSVPAAHVARSSGMTRMEMSRMVSVSGPSGMLNRNDRILPWRRWKRARGMRRRRRAASGRRCRLLQGSRMSRGSRPTAWHSSASRALSRAISSGGCPTLPDVGIARNIAQHSMSLAADEDRDMPVDRLGSERGCVKLVVRTSEGRHVVRLQLPKDFERLSNPVDALAGRWKRDAVGGVLVRSMLRPTQG